MVLSFDIKPLLTVGGGGMSDKQTVSTNCLTFPDFDIRFTERDLTANGGTVLLRKFVDAIGLRSAYLDWNIPLPGSGRGYDPMQLIEQFIVSVWTGAEHFTHCEQVRNDKALAKIFGWEKQAEHKAIQRLFKKIDNPAKSINIAKSIYRFCLGKIPFQGLTLDFDSTVITRYGDQEGSALGYNPRAHGRHSHHPLIAFLGSIRLIANFWLRSGNSGADNNFKNFLPDTLDNFREGQVSAVRADSGFWCKENIDILNKKGLSYAISVKLKESVKKAIIFSQTPWKEIKPGLEIKDFLYTSATWTEPQRMIAVRRHKSLGEDVIGKQLNLFDNEDFNEEWKYSVITTNIPFEDVEIWRFYRQRANCENQIKELKADFGLDHFVMNRFWATEIALIFCTLAYNLMSMFKLLAIRSKIFPTRSTLYRHFFSVPGVWQKSKDSENKPILWLSIHNKLRKSFVSMWENIGTQVIPD